MNFLVRVQFWSSRTKKCCVFWSKDKKVLHVFVLPILFCPTHPVLVRPGLAVAVTSGYSHVSSLDNYVEHRENL